MSKKSIADASAELYRLLEPFDPSERKRIVRGTLTLLGEPVADTQADNETDLPQVRGTTGKSAREYFDLKKPNNKIEELVTAARFHEQREGGESSTKEDFKKIISDARRNFDNVHFTRDVDNARSKGYFNKGGTAKAGYTLSYFGQNYVDALPDRDAAKKIQRPKRAGARKSRKGRTKAAK